eukprot:4925906-Pyramimonas_sp.AAC.1
MGTFRGLIWASRGPLAASWAHFGGLWGILEPSWGGGLKMPARVPHLGPFGTVLEALGPFLGARGAIWGASGAVLGALKTEHAMQKQIYG